MKDIENVLLEEYGLKRSDFGLNGPRCIGTSNNCMTGFVAKPGHYDMTGKWIVRFIPTIQQFVPGGLAYFELGAMVEERFDSKDDCIEYLHTQKASIYEKLYAHTLDVIKNMAKSIEDLENLDPCNRGLFKEVLK